MKNIFLIVSLFIIVNVFAQRGKDGDKVVSGTETVNAYTTLTINAGLGDTSITVANSNLNTNFSGNLTAGDLVMIIQVQGVSIIDMAHPGQTADWGRVTDYGNCGNYEFAQVESVPDGTTINFDCALSNNYSADQKVIVVRVPRYNTLTITGSGLLTVSQWDGVSGGILAVEVVGVTTITAPGRIDVSEFGFRGGTSIDPPFNISGGDRYADASRVEGSEKGEGIVGDFTFYQDSIQGPYCRGAAANAGGGGNQHNAGGGGGANGGNIANWNNGVGTPDISNGYGAAWNLETVLTGLSSATVSSGGGRGGYSLLSEDRDGLSDVPGTTFWGTNKRDLVGGLGGRPLDYSTGKIFMGGAGGAGDQNNNEGGDGGNAGGLVFLKTYDAISGDGDIIANGEDGGNSFGNAPFGGIAGADAGGGGGSGGTIILQTTSSVTLTGQIEAIGGKGGDQFLTAGLFASVEEAAGPGGGGGGGYIALTSGAPTTVTTGGINGVTDSPYITEFPPNGATIGGEGVTETLTLDAFDLTANDVAICPNNTANLTATITGTAPGGTSIEWYDAEFNGTLLQTGANYTTPILSSNTTYYVKTCPGDFMLPVNVTMNGCGTPPTVSFESSDSTLCIGSCIDFTDLSSDSPTSWNWYFFGSDSLTSTQQNPTNICYNTPGPHAVALVATNASGTDSLYIDSFITVTALPTVIASAIDTSVCLGDSTTLSGSGANTYSWDNSITDGVIFAPGTTQLYTVIGTDTNLCQNSDTLTIHVNSLPNVIASATDTSVCLGDSTTLSGSGANTYSWDNSVTDGVIFAPGTTQLYTVIGTDANLCQNSDTLTIHVNSLPNVIASATDTSVCLGDSTTLAGSGANTYSWDNSVTDGVIFAPATTQLYTVIGTDANLCQNSDTLTIHVNPPTTPAFNAVSPICSGDALSPLPTTSNDGYTGSWSPALDNTTTTTYTFTPDAAQCATTATMTITVNSTPATPTFTAVSPICNGDLLNPLPTTSNDGYTGSWSPAVDNTITTTYTFTPDPGQCANTTTLDIVVNNNSTPTFTPVTPICSGDALSPLPTTSDNGITGSWSPALDNTSTTTYTFTPDAGQCAITTTLDIVVSTNTTPTFTQLGPYCVFATPDILPTTSNDGVTGTWDAAISTANAGTITYTFTPSIGCFTTATMDVVTSFNLVSTFTQLGPYCTGDSPDVLPTTSNNGITGSWDAAISTATAGTITYTFTPDPTPGGNCTSIVTMDVTVSSSITPTFTAVAPICSGDALTPLPTTSNNGVTGSWSPTLDNTATTTYTFTPDPGQCASTEVLTITVNSTPATPTFTTVSSICIGDVLNPLPTTSNDGYTGSWSPALDNTTTTTYTFSPDAGQCATSTTVEIMVNSCTVVIEPEVIIPNVFSPNIDGHNDQFTISGTGIIAVHYSIYNRWGELIFETSQLNEGWNGRTNSGIEVPEGTYFYIATVTTTDGEESHHGSITLIR